MGVFSPTMKTVAFITVLSFGLACSAAADLTARLCSGDPVPWSPGDTFSSAGTIYSISGVGHLVGAVNYGAGERAIYLSHPDGTVEKVVAEGESVGNLAEPMKFLGTALVADTAAVAVRARFRPTGLTFDRGAVLAGAAGNMTAVLYEGQPLPGIDPAATLANFGFSSGHPFFHFNRSGNLAVGLQAAIPGSLSKQAIWMDGNFILAVGETYPRPRGRRKPSSGIYSMAPRRRRPAGVLPASVAGSGWIPATASGSTSPAACSKIVRDDPADPTDGDVELFGLAAGRTNRLLLPYCLKDPPTPVARRHRPFAHHRCRATPVPRCPPAPPSHFSAPPLPRPKPGGKRRPSAGRYRASTASGSGAAAGPARSHRARRRPPPPGLPGQTIGRALSDPRILDTGQVLYRAVVFRRQPTPFFDQTSRPHRRGSPFSCPTPPRPPPTPPTTTSPRPTPRYSHGGPALRLQ